nr:EOG090X0AGI [Sida crystallina]
MDRVEEKLWIGGLDAALNSELLAENGIFHIVTVDIKPIPQVEGFNHLFIRAQDIASEDLLSFFEESFEFIEKGMRTVFAVLNTVKCLTKGTNNHVNATSSIVYHRICDRLKLLDRFVVGFEDFDALHVPTSYLLTGRLTTEILFLDFSRVRPAIEPKDLKLGIINHLGSRVSGVLLAAINDGNKNMSKMISNRPLAVYQIKGELGLATDTHWHDGKIWEKSTYAHLSKGKIDRVLTSIEATNQRKMFEYCGVDSTSQTAYELACQGLLRPAANGPTMIYSIKCIHFDLPYYTLELHAINEKADYLVKLIHDLGIALKTTSVCHQIRCIRYGHFKLEHALLRKHWKVEHLINNMHLCHEMLRDIPRVTPVISPVSSKSSELDRIP